MIAVASVGLVAQIAAASVLARADRSSLNVRAAYLHALTDAFQSLGVVGSGIAVRFTGLFIIDPIISIAIGIGIFWSASKIVAEAAHVLLEGTPAGLDLGSVHRAMLSVAGVQSVTDLHAWSLTSGYNALSAHVVGQDGLDAHQREDLCRDLCALLQRDFPLQHVTLQVEQSCTHAETNDCCTKWMGQEMP
jgi:cobalt-zinc-cadmium efflux system protein